ncbi:MAG: excinuclease ABC subunit UvrC [Bacteroidales bacterium]|nr:excinuclease ABC subunit UvrC [Bacteroidales bacterium]
MEEINKHYSKLEPIIRALPNQPGIYQYYDEEGKILYIGKAKSLRKRVSSYFKKDLFGKTRVLVKKIFEIRTTIVETEMDALLLENNLIKKYQPRYNILLKDDKTFPWICIKNEAFPRIFPTRNIIKDGSEYYGPYASGKMMHTILDLIKQLYTLRNCKFKLSAENIQKKKFKVCLEYHIGNCKGPCIGEQTPEDYEQTISEIRQIIKGNVHSVAKKLKSLMMEYAETMEFEKAQQAKEKWELLQNYQAKSTVVSPTINNVDVYSIISDEKSGYANFLRVVNGAIVQTHTIEMKKKLDETDTELLDLAIMDFYQRFNSDSKEIIIPFKPEVQFPGIKYTVPVRGDKKSLLELSTRNAKYYRMEKEKQKDLVDPERHSKRILNQMMKDLRMQELPKRIECFDNSNIQGEFPVAAMVCFINAKPAKKEYRHYNIKTVEGPNDFASMEEVIYRRYKRLLDEEKELPQLIIVDGGKGQLSSALLSLEKLGLRGKITIIGIAKRLEEIYYPGDSHPLYLDKTSETLKIIQYSRDEAHRFGITHHRKRREKGTIKTGLTDIPGIGEKTAQSLLQSFRSVKKLKEAEQEAIVKVVGLAKARIILDFFANEEK